MPNNFHYAAISYLNEWVLKDRHFCKHLGTGEERFEDGPAVLVEAATYYGVIRTLKLIEEEPRLLAAHELLKCVENISAETVVEDVGAFATKLGDIYGARRNWTVLPLSAASKFLWKRFKSPVIIYDSINAAWLDKAGYRCDTYGRYCGCWHDAFAKHKQQISETCSELFKVRKFTLACDCDIGELRQWTESPWFSERVFDHYMQNESNFQPR